MNQFGNGGVAPVTSDPSFLVSFFFFSFFFCDGDLMKLVKTAMEIVMIRRLRDGRLTMVLRLLQWSSGGLFVDFGLMVVIEKLMKLLLSK